MGQHIYELVLGGEFVIANNGNVKIISKGRPGQETLYRRTCMKALMGVDGAKLKYVL